MLGSGTRTRVRIAMALVGAVFAVGAASAGAATIPVACADNTALANAITTANGNPGADTIDITGAPCTFSLTAPAVNAGANGNNTGLPVVTTPITIAGHGATIERALSALVPFRILFANGATANLTLQDLTIKSGVLNSGNVGAGIATFGSATLSLDGVTVTQNTISGTSGTTPAYGAGLWTSGGTVTIDHSAFTTNTAHIAGAMALNGTAVTVRRSVFSGNSTTNPAVGSGSTGVAWVQGGTVNFENSTFSGNSSQNGIGGITVSNLGATAGTVNVASSTFADNGRTGLTNPGGALFRFPNGTSPGPVTINVTDTIVTDTDSTAAATLAPCTGVTPTAPANSNIEWPTSTCGFSNTVDPKLAPIALNGGRTNNFRPLSDSPAIDLSGVTCPATDQRDVARPDGEGCDTGSYETPAPDTTASGPSAPTNDPQVTFTSPDTPTATFECKVDSGSFAACTSPFSPNVGSGTHTVQVRAINPSGAYVDKTPASVTFTVDKTAPVVTITGAPSSPTPDDTPTFTFTVDDSSATVTCQVDSETPVACSSPYTTPPLSNGSHTVKVIATDPVGNVGSDQRTIVVDIAASQTFSVACGDVAALRAAITSANATFAHDTIDVTGGPCTFTLTDSVNAASGGNGLPIVVHPLTVDGHGATIERSAVAGTPNFRIWFASGATDAATKLTLHNMTILRGSIVGGNIGAGVASFLAGIELDKVTLTANSALGTSGSNIGRGGAVGTIGGTLDADHSTFAFNTAVQGGAVATDLTPGTVRRSLFFGNGGTSTATTGAVLVLGETVTFENDTIAGNTATNGIGGIAVVSSGTSNGIVNVRSTTLYNNRRQGVVAPGGALWAAASNVINVADTIVTDDSTAAASFPPCTGAIANDGGNLEWPGASCGFGTNANPKLGAAVAYSGGASGYPLLSDSPAIELGGDTCPATDQHDKARPDGALCDSGALEAPEPETIANGPASDPTNDPKVTFSSPDTPSATFECKLDSGAFATCTSPYSPAMSDGPHTVLVRAVAPGGYPDRTPASVTFTVDKTAPVVNITSAPPAPPALTDDNTPTIEFTVDDPDATITCKVDTDAAVPCTSPFTTDPLSDGQHTIVVTAVDPVGNGGTDSVTFVVDTAPPQTLDVACGDVAALRAAITSANATLAHDTIDVTGGPCTFTLHDSVNPAAGGNGLPIVIHPLTVEGHGATIERSADSGTPNFRIWFVAGTTDPATSLTLRDMIVLRGSLANGNVGAGVAAYLADLTLDGVTLQSNLATGGGSNGGGVWTSGGKLDVDHSSFYFNQAVTGAALATTNTPGTVRRSTFYLNGGSSTASGATAWVQGETVTFENDTIAGNVANNGIGGIIASNSGATSGVVNVVSSTLFNQRKTSVNAPAAHLYTFHQSGSGSETIHVADSILTDSSTAAPALAACTGAVTDDGGNLEWPGTSCGFGTHADPLLDTVIALHGGKTFNYRLLPASPAIELGGATCPAVDQRDATRPDGDACDSGSYETPAPETTSDPPASDPTKEPKVTFTSPDTANATFQCKVDDGAFVACTSPYSPALSDGPHTIAIRAVDPDGYVDPSPAVETFTVDTTPPVVDITAATPSPTSDTTPTIEFTVDDAGASVQCKVDGGPRQTCSSPFTTDPLPEGKHTITVYATDSAGNEGSDAVTIAISFGPPDTTITSGPSGTIYNQTSATFTFTSSKPSSTFECRLDTQAFAACTSPHTVSGYAEGTHTFQVRALDIAGVPDPTPASRTFTYKHCNVLRVITNVLGQPVVICL